MEMHNGRSVLKFALMEEIMRLAAVCSCAEYDGERAVGAP